MIALTLTRPKTVYAYCGTASLLCHIAVVNMLSANDIADRTVRTLERIVLSTPGQATAQFLRTLSNSC